MKKTVFLLLLLTGCAAQQQSTFYAKRESLRDDVTCLLLRGEAARANPAFAADVRREINRRGIEQACITLYRQQMEFAASSVTVGISAISAARQMDAQSTTTAPTGNANPNQRGYQTRDAYGNLVNSNSKYTTRDAYGNLVNSTDNHMTRDSFGNLVGSSVPHQTLDAYGNIVNVGQ